MCTEFISNLRSYLLRLGVSGSQLASALQGHYNVKKEVGQRPEIKQANGSAKPTPKNRNANMIGVLFYYVNHLQDYQNLIHQRQPQGQWMATRMGKQGQLNRHKIRSGLLMPPPHGSSNGGDRCHSSSKRNHLRQFLRILQSWGVVDLIPRYNMNWPVGIEKILEECEEKKTKKCNQKKDHQTIDAKDRKGERDQLPINGGPQRV